MGDKQWLSVIGYLETVVINDWSVGTKVISDWSLVRLVASDGCWEDS